MVLGERLSRCQARVGMGTATAVPGSHPALPSPSSGALWGGGLLVACRISLGGAGAPVVRAHRVRVLVRLETSMITDNYSTVIVK